MCVYACVSYGFVIAAEAQGSSRVYGRRLFSGWIGREEIRTKWHTLCLPALQLQLGKHGHTRASTQSRIMPPPFFFPSSSHAQAWRLIPFSCRPPAPRINDCRPPRSSVLKAWMWTASSVGSARWCYINSFFYWVEIKWDFRERKRSVKNSFGPERAHSLHSVVLNYVLL